MISKKINVINSFNYVSHRLTSFGRFVTKGNSFFHSDLKIVLSGAAPPNL